MPKRSDISTILIIGSGPIVIGQACEFDYSGVQACLALHAEGYKVILLNSNPATIMTDKFIADRTYIEPLTVETVKKIVELEKVDAILPTMGGQTALNLAMAYYQQTLAEEFSAEIIGANPDSIEKAENRQAFYKLMHEYGLECPQGYQVRSYQEALQALEKINFPVIIRSSYTLGGEGSSFAYTYEDFKEKVNNALLSSPIHQALIEESVYGWKEYEMEVMRDQRDNCVVVCSIENIDAMGVHTGDSITVAPAMTLTDKEYQKMRDASFTVLRAIGVETGGANVQFAVNPLTGKMFVIEMNPRVSRSSALASKATGFPIAKISAKLSVGYCLDEIMNEITKKSCAAFEPSIDYVVTKIPRFDFDKFPMVSHELGTSMQSVGEAMAIGRTFKESFQKAIRSLEIGVSGLTEIKYRESDKKKQQKIVKKKVKTPSPERFFYIAEAIRQKVSLEEISKLSNWDPWFLEQIESIVKTENYLKDGALSLHDLNALRQVKSMGFSNRRLSEITDLEIKDIEILLNKFEIKPVFRRVDTCAAEFSSDTAYLYSSYLPYESSEDACESFPSARKKVITLGSGPNHIGQGIEFDYCCVQASCALRDSNIESIMINCNPETVSTDHTISDKLYFSPLTDEDVLEIIKRENTKGEILGVIVQLGGQSSLKLANALKEANIPILGTSFDSIDIAENRNRCRNLLEEKSFKQPDNFVAQTIEDLYFGAKKLGYPIIVRPSYVIGGKCMEVIYDHESLEKSPVFKNFRELSPILVEKFLENAVEVEVDLLCDQNDVYIAGIVEHFEKAGIHSGDSTCIIPTQNVSSKIIAQIKNCSIILAKHLQIKGLMNIQFAVLKEELYVLEINPRASRTIPFLSKATDVPLAYIAAKVIIDKSLKHFGLGDYFKIDGVAIKKPIFSFHRLKEVDPVLGPEMKSTGEVMYTGFDLAEVNHKVLVEHFAAGFNKDKKILILSPYENNKPICQLSNDLKALGYSVLDVFDLAVNKEVFINVIRMLENDQVSIVINLHGIGLTRYRQAILKSKTLELTTIFDIRGLAENLTRLNSTYKIRTLQDRRSHENNKNFLKAAS